MFHDDIHAFFIRDLADFFGNFLLVVIDAVIRAERRGLSSFSSSPAVVMTRQ